VHLEAVEHGERIVFMHTVRPGPASQSYGLQVAALAGVPAAVLQRARTKLAELESPSANTPQLSLFAGPPDAPSPPTAANPQAEAVYDALQALDPDDLSPREALEALYRLRGLVSAGDETPPGLG
jgi:DNA mismatch repair protein MutS